jgi:hypothetical protein
MIMSKAEDLLLRMILQCIQVNAGSHLVCKGRDEPLITNSGNSVSTLGL